MEKSVNSISTPPVNVDRSMEALIKVCHRDAMGSQPLLLKMSSQKVDWGKTYEFLANLSTATSVYPSQLSALIPRLDNVKIGSIVTKLLNDEYGAGDENQVHVDLFEQSLQSLARFKPAGFDKSQLHAGREMRERVIKLFQSSNPYVGVGVVMAGEIIADQMISWLGREIARQDDVKLSELSWYGAHAGIEADHAKDSSRIGALVGSKPENLEAAWQGAEGALAAQKQFCSTLMKRFYPEA